MKEVILITGTSRGIGKALATQFLTQMAVVGLSRSDATISHENYHHLQVDLEKVDQQELNTIGKALNAYDQVHILHNAGIIQPIVEAFKIEKDQLERNHQINFIAPVALNTALLDMMANQVKTISFIGSGAARHTIDAWSAYCTSKVALLMYANCLQQEFDDRKIPIKVYDFSPGVVGTKMQEEIRNADQDVFMESEKFHQLYESGELVEPEIVANTIFKIITKKTTDQLEINLREFY